MEIGTELQKETLKLVILTAASISGIGCEHLKSVGGKGLRLAVEIAARFRRRQYRQESRGIDRQL